MSTYKIAGKTALDCAKLRKSQMANLELGQQQNDTGLASLREIIELLEEASEQC